MLELAQYNIIKHTTAMELVNWIYFKVFLYEKQTYLFGLGDLSTVENPSGRTVLVTTGVPNKFGKCHLVTYFGCLCCWGCLDYIPGCDGLKLFDQKFCSPCFEIVNALPAEVKLPGGANDD